KIGDWPGDDDRHALPNTFARKSTMQFMLGHGAFALIEHLDVAAQRNRSNGELSAVSIAPAIQDFAEANGKTQHSYATTASYVKMTELVDSNQHHNRDQKP